MRGHVIAGALVCWALQSPVAARAQDATGQVLVFVAPGPLADAFRLELEARGRVVHIAPLIDHPTALARETGALAALWLEGPTIVVWVAARDAISRLRIPDAEPRVTALVGAAMLEEELTVARPFEPVADTAYHPPAIAPYASAGPVGFLRLAPRVNGLIGMRSSVGIQWREGPRVGLVWCLDGHDDRGGADVVESVFPAWGIEAGARLGDGLLVLHVGGHVLVGIPRPHVHPELVIPTLMLMAGGYVGMGFQVHTRGELSLRGIVEVWEEPQWATTPVIRGAVVWEWR